MATIVPFALRVLLQDWIGTEMWVTLFNEMAAKALGFTTNSYVAMTSDEDRFASLSVLRGVRVMELHVQEMRLLWRYGDGGKDASHTNRTTGEIP